MTTFIFNDKVIYIDERLKKQLDNKIIPFVQHKDKDCVFVVDGEERTGKSVFAQGIAAYLCSQLGTSFDLSNICFTPEEFKHKIETAERNSVIIFDESHSGLSSSSSLSLVNKILKDLFMECGQKNLIIFVVLPTFFLLEKYIALFRTKALFHIYERKGERGFFVLFNKRNKLKLYLNGKKELNYNCLKYPKNKGRFSNTYAVDETLYRKKKSESFKHNTEYIKEEDKELEIIKTLTAQRNILIAEDYKNQGSFSKLAKYYENLGLKGLKETSLKAIMHQIPEKVSEKGDLKGDGG